MGKLRVTLISGHLPPAGGREEFMRQAASKIDSRLIDLFFIFYDRNPVNVNGIWHQEHLSQVRVARTPEELQEAWRDVGGGIKQSHINPSAEIEGLPSPASIQVIHNLHRMDSVKCWDRVVGVSRWVRGRQPAQYPVQVIYNGVDETIFTPSVSEGQEMRQKLGIPLNAVVVGWAGFLTEVKRLEKFVAVALQVLSKRDDVWFLAVGTTPAWGGPAAISYERQIRSLAEKAGKRFIWHVGDVVKPQELVNYYRAMDIFYLSSDFETFARTGAESMACGVVPVVGLSSGMSELVGTHGFTVTSKVEDAIKAITYLIKHPDVRKEMSEWSKRRVNEYFRADKQMLKFEQLWLSLAREKGLLEPKVSAYAVKQELMEQDLQKKVLVIAPTNGPSDFSNYLSVSAERIGMQRWHTETYREYVSRTLAVRRKEFDESRERIFQKLLEEKFDLAICLKMMEWTPKEIDKLRDAAPGTKFVHWMTDITAEAGEETWLLPILERMDAAFMTGLGLVHRYRDKGIKAYWAVEGFCDKYFVSRTVPLDTDVLFIGNVNSLGGFPGGLTLGWQYPDREDVVRNLFSWALRNKVTFRAWGPKTTTGVHISGMVLNEEFAKKVSGARIVLSPAGLSSPLWREPYYTSNRLYLYLGCGGFVLNQYFPGIEDFFQNHVDLVWFTSVSEAEHLIQWYLSNPDKRAEIAQRGHQKACRRFRTDHELKKVLAVSFDRQWFEGYGYTE